MPLIKQVNKARDVMDKFCDQFQSEVEDGSKITFNSERSKSEMLATVDSVQKELKQIYNKFTWHELQQERGLHSLSGLKNLNESIIRLTGTVRAKNQRILGEALKRRERIEDALEAARKGDVNGPNDDYHKAMYNYKRAGRTSMERLETLYDTLRDFKRRKFEEEDEVRIVVDEDEDSEEEEDSLALPAVE